MDWNNVILRKENKIGFITLNQPEVYSARGLMSPEGAQRLMAFLEKK